MAQPSSTGRKLRRFVGIGSAQRGLLLEAVVCLVLARLALVLLPFPILARRIGSFMRPDEAHAAQAQFAMSQEGARIAGEIGRAVTRAARHVPFRAVCLPQAIAARLMLTRRGVKSVLHFGAAKGKDKAFNAHAWLDAGGVEVTGYPVAQEFAEIACFV